MEEQFLLRECMTDAGCSADEIAAAEKFYDARRYDDLTRLLKKCRFAFLEEMHECGRKIDRMDLLIRRSEQITK